MERGGGGKYFFTCDPWLPTPYTFGDFGASINRPIVLLGSGLEAGHPDRAADLFIHFAMLKMVKPAHLLPPSPVLLSPLPAGILPILTLLGFFD